jgi:hypothetical protein
MLSTHAAWNELILGIPSIGLLFVAFFRQVETVARPRTGSGIGRPLSHVGENGDFVCIEPDGRYSAEVVEGTGRGLAHRREGHLPRRGGLGATRRVSVEWVRNDWEE